MAMDVAEEKTEEELSQSLDSYIRYMPSRGVDAQSGKVTIIDSATEYSYEFRAFGKFPVELSLNNQYIGIENTTAIELPAHLVGLTAGVETTLPFFRFDETYLRLGIYPSFFGDDWDFPASSFRIPSRAYLIYMPNPRWTFIGGVTVYPEFENEVLPILGFMYKPNERLTFNIIPKRPNISYLLNDKITLFAEGGSSLNSEFEVDKDDLKNVVLRYKETHLGAGIKYKLNKFIQGSLSAGGVFNRYVKYRDGQGKVDIKDGLYSDFRLEINI
jgi:hypothetical protein